MIKVDCFTKIELYPIEDKEFYAYIIPEEEEWGILFGVWIFRKGYGTALFSYGENEGNNPGQDIIFTKERIQEMDAAGEFDAEKYKLLELE